MVTNNDAAVSGGEAAQPLGVAVIGAGYWGPNLVRNFQGSTSDSGCAGLCDLDVARARKVLGGYSTVEVTDDLARACWPTRTVDAVAIATPAARTTRSALAALRGRQARRWSRSRWPPACADGQRDGRARPSGAGWS